MRKYLTAFLTAGLFLITAAAENSAAEPDFLKGVPAEKIIRFGPEILTYKNSNKFVKEDADSAVGKSLCTPAPNANWKHGLQVKKHGGRYSSTINIYNWTTKKSGPTITIKDFPADEKFHWYKLWDYEFQPGRTSMLIWWWQMQANLSKVYKAGANNKYTVYVSLKFTGSSYVPDSKKQDAFYIDQVILVQKSDR